jgi:hypothetical protein
VWASTPRAAHLLESRRRGLYPAGAGAHARTHTPYEICLPPLLSPPAGTLQFNLTCGDWAGDTKPTEALSRHKGPKAWTPPSSPCDLVDSHSCAPFAAATEGTVTKSPLSIRRRSGPAGGPQPQRPRGGPASQFTQRTGGATCHAWWGIRRTWQYSIYLAFDPPCG